MASPFSVFRRNQGVLLAVFGVALMIAFVVLPAVIQLQSVGGGGGTYSSDAVLTWTNGEVTDTDISNRMQRRRMTAEFLLKLREAAAKSPGGEELNRRRDGGMVARLQNNSRASAVETMVLVQKGRDLGLSVDDGAVRAFLHNVTDDMFTKEGDLDKKISEAIDGVTTAPAMFKELSEELLAHHVLMMGFGGSMTTPSEAWEYFNRLNRRVSAEFVPFPTTDYVAQVEDPSSRELEAYFDEHKLQLPSINSDTVGFKVPRKVEVYYVVAEFETFLDEAKANVTEGEIETYYEEHKEDFRIFDDDFPDFGDTDDPRSALPSPPIVPDDAPTDESPVEGTDGPAETDTPPVDEQGATDDEAGEADSTEAGTSEDEPAGDEEPSECQDEPADTEDTTETDDGQGDAVEPPTEDDPAAGSDGEPDATPSESEASPDGSDTPGSSSTDDLALPEPKYKPLADVRDTILSRLARPVAQQKMDAALAKVRKAVEDHYEKTLDFELEGKEDPGVYDGKALADELGLAHGTTGLTDIVSLYKARKELDIVESSQISGQQPQGFMQLLFAPGRLNYQPIATTTFDPEKHFLSWKVAEEEAYVPELEDIRDEVVAAWKTEQARELAKSAANKLADRLDGKKPLKEQAGSDHDVLMPPAFSYFEPRSVDFTRMRMGRPIPDSIKDIEEQSSDVIRKEVVNMPVGTIRVLPTADKSIFYVVRVASDNDADGEARDDFMQDIVDSEREGLPDLIMYAAGNDRQEVVFDWYENLEEEYEVKRIKPEYFLE